MENRNLENKDSEVIAHNSQFRESKESKENKKMNWLLKKNIKTAFFLIFVILSWILIVQYVVADKYVATVQVKGEGSATGVNPTSEKLDYGDISKGGSVVRSITVSNGGNVDVYIKIFKNGEIAELIETEKNDFTLKSGEEENIEFVLKIPVNANERNYNGKVLIFKLPKLF
jgi:hypothetical protein